MIILKLMGLADGRATKYDGWYLKSFDFEAYDGRGADEFTQSPDEALAFPDLAAALEFRHRQPECMPLRPDGLPNRPMTACNWMTEIIADRPNGK